LDKPSITFIQSDPAQFLASTHDSYDYIIFCHSVWYFETPTRFAQLLQTLGTRRMKRELLITEYALHSPSREAFPQILAALAQTSLEVEKATSSGNIRTVVSPAWLKTECEKLGWKLRSERQIVPGADLLDGKSEVQAVLSERFLADVGKHCGSDSNAVPP